MNDTDWIGFIGVSLILLAFFLNATNKLSSDHSLYLGLNATGAAIACLASYLISYWPFVILEGAWTVVSLWALLRKRKAP
jgi:hypothetical protein